MSAYDDDDDKCLSLLSHRRNTYTNLCTRMGCILDAFQYYIFRHILLRYFFIMDIFWFFFFLEIKAKIIDNYYLFKYIFFFFLNSLLS